MKVGDLVKHTADGGMLGAGLVTDVSLEPDLISVLWSNSNRIGGASRGWLEVISEITPDSQETSAQNFSPTKAQHDGINRTPLQSRGPHQD
jgi:hypothetical protein